MLRENGGDRGDTERTWKGQGEDIDGTWNERGKDREVT